MDKFFQKLRGEIIKPRHNIISKMLIQRTPIYNYLEQIYYITFEVSNSCNLSSKHGKCPINSRPKGCTPISNEKVLNFIKFCSKHGWKGKMAFHYYNDPLMNKDRVISLRDNCGVKSDLWTNGLLLQPNDDAFILSFNRVRITKYHDNYVDQFSKYPNVSIYNADMDDRLTIYDCKPNLVHDDYCLRPYNEIPIDYWGNIHLCCIDWRHEIEIGDLNKDNPDIILIKHERLLSGIFTGQILPSVCQKCRWKLKRRYDMSTI